MDETIIPNEFLSRIRANPRMTFLLHVEASPDRRDCTNCGGLGEINVFHADMGPMRNVPPPRRNKVVHSMDDEVYGYVWYSGETHGLPCPVCMGTGKADYSQARQEVPEPAEIFEDHTV